MPTDKTDKTDNTTITTWNQGSRAAAETVANMLPFGDAAKVPHSFAHLRATFGQPDDEPWNALRRGAYRVLACDVTKARPGYGLYYPFLMDVSELGARKQHDYGTGNILAFGHDGIIVRISDKLARIENLTKRGVDPENEALEDSYQDIVGYCLIGLMLLDGTFTLPLEGAG